jgi:SAM-dependent methyltransferase
MRNEQNASPVTSSHYDESYYRGHYRSVVGDDLNYRLLSLYWRYVIFERNGLSIGGKLLDFGSGLGQVSAALPDTVCFDYSSYALEELRKRGRIVLDRRQDIERGAFEYVLSSHSLEHSPTPFYDLQEFREYVRPAGRLILALPIEKNDRPTLRPDWDQHLQTWTFQTITNLLLVTGWKPLFQSVIYGPYMLRTLGKQFSAIRAVRAAYGIGRLKRGYRTMLTIAAVS